MNIHEGHAKAGSKYFESAHFQWRSQNTEKLHRLKRDYWIKQWMSSIAPFFKMGTALKGKNYANDFSLPIFSCFQ